MKRVLSVLLIFVLLMGSMVSGFAAKPATPFNADEEINIKMTGSPPAPAATISFNVEGGYTSNGINYNFNLLIPYDVDPLVITIMGYDGSSVDYELGTDPYTETPENVKIIEIPRSGGPAGGIQDIDIDVKWFPLSDSSQEVMHGTIHVEWEPAPIYSVTTMEEPPEGGTATGDVVSVPLGTPYSLLATANPDWDFIGWGIEDADPNIMDNPLVGTVASTTYFTAHFEYNPPPVATYSVTTMAMPLNGGLTTGDVVGVPLGTPYSLLATANPDWDFIGWGLEDADPNMMDNPLVGTVASTTYFTAHFEYNPPPVATYSVTTIAMPSGGGTTTGDVEGVPLGTPYSLLAQPNPDWNFIGWGIEDADPTIMDNPLLGTVASTTYFTAHFEYDPPQPGRYSVTTMRMPPEGGTTTGDVVNVSLGTPYSLLATANPDWDFIGWGIEDADPTIMDNPLIGTVASTTYFTAHFEPIATYSVTTMAMPTEGGTTTGDVVGVPLGTPYELTAIPNYSEGYYFVGWGIEGAPPTIMGTPLIGTVASTTYFTAYFEQEGPEMVYLHIDSEDHGYTVPTEGTHMYPIGATVAVAAYGDDMYWYFDEWVGTNGSEVVDGVILMDNDKWITATFTYDGPEMVELTIEIDGGGEVDTTEGFVSSSRTFIVTAGTTVYMIPDADSGHYFDEWNGPDQSDVYNEGSGEYSIYMDEDKEIEAEFNKRSSPGPIIIRNRLKITIEGNGTVDPFVGSQTYTPGTDVSVTADPGSGWTFEGWFGPDGGDVIDGVIDMDEDKSIIARFVQSPTPPPIEPPEIIIPLVETPLGDGDLPDTGQAFPIESLGIGLMLMMVGTLTRKKDDQ
jgi:hypothetical protein